MTLDEIPSAWKGLEAFAGWIVKLHRPALVVDLGVDNGYSTCAFALAGAGRVVGIDRNPDSIATTTRNAAAFGFSDRITLACTDFATAAALFSEPVDLLHIDGDHDFESVSRDFACWFPKVRKGGVILFHDTMSFPDGVGRFFATLPEPKFEIHNFHGLGVMLNT